MKGIIHKLLTISLIIASCFTVSSCSEDEVILSTDGKIVSVSLTGNNIEIIENEGSNSVINIYLDYDHQVQYDDIAITISAGATISQGAVDVEGDVTGGTFEDNVTMLLTVTAEDGISKTSYDVTVNISKNTKADIIIFKHNDVDGIFNIPTSEDGNYIIDVVLPVNTILSSAYITISAGATISQGTLDEQGNVTGLSFEDGITKTLTITSEDGELTNSYDITVTIDTSFISRWNVYGGDTIVLPLYEGGVYNFIVNWGDGSPEESINSPNAKHEYSNGGIYTITTKGELEGFNFEQTNTSSYKIIDIVQWGNLKLGNLGGYFSYCAYMY